jgi:hypothetical protein
VRTAMGAASCNLHCTYDNLSTCDATGVRRRLPRHRAAPTTTTRSVSTRAQRLQSALLRPAHAPSARPRRHAQAASAKRCLAQPVPPRQTAVVHAAREGSRAWWEWAGMPRSTRCSSDPRRCESKLQRAGSFLGPAAVRRWRGGGQRDGADAVQPGAAAAQRRGGDAGAAEVRPFARVRLCAQCRAHAANALRASASRDGCQSGAA